jgi:hypothetical protein
MDNWRANLRIGGLQRKKFVRELLERDAREGHLWKGNLLELFTELL